MLDRSAADEFQAQLLRRIAGQDREAVADFYDQTAGILFSAAVRILGDNHDAEEVMQDVFVQIWQKAPMFDAALGTPLHWALGITRNRCIDRLRSRQRRSRLVEKMTEEADIAHAAAARAGQENLSGEELDAVRSAVKSLPDDQRRAIEMAFFGGLSHVEIAGAMNEPLGTVKARIRRGMMKLRNDLQPYI